MDFKTGKKMLRKNIVGDDFNIHQFADVAWQQQFKLRPGEIGENEMQ